MDKPKTPDQPEPDQLVGRGFEAAEKVNPTDIYLTEIIEGPLAHAPRLSQASPSTPTSTPTSAQNQIQAPKPPPAKLLGEPEPQKSHLLRYTLITTTIISLILLFGWNTFNHNYLRWPIDFGVQTAFLLFATVLLAHSIILFSQHLRKVTRRQTELTLLYPLYILIMLSAFLGIGYLEFRPQFVQIITTPITREISGVPTALVQCDRAVANLFAPTRKGYTYIEDGIARFHPNACVDIFNWYVWQGKTNTTDYQIHTLDMIAHEAVHISGVYNELITKCASTEWTEDVLLHLGAKPEEAERIAKRNRYMLNNFQGTGPGSQSNQYVGNCDNLPSFRKD